MTRREFEEDINDISDLYWFCCDHDLYEELDELGIFSESSVMDEVQYELWDSGRFARNDISEIRDFLNACEEGYDFYKRRNGYFYPYPYEGDFESDKQDILEVVLENFPDLFDVEEEEYEEEEPKEEVIDFVDFVAQCAAGN